MAGSRFDKYLESPVQFQSPQTGPDIAHTGAQTQEITATLPSKVAEGRAKAVTAQAEAHEATAQQHAKTLQEQGKATQEQFKGTQEHLVTQHQEAMVKNYGENVNTLMRSVDLARQLIAQNPGQFSPAAYRIMQHIPGTAANRVADLIDSEKGPIAAGNVLNTINSFREEAGANPGGGGGQGPRVFRSEIPLFSGRVGPLDPGHYGAATVMNTLDNIERDSKRQVAIVNGENPDDPAAMKKYGIPPTPTMESSQSKLTAGRFIPGQDQVLFNDEGKPGQLSPSQQAQEQAYLKANPNTTPEAFGSFLSSLTGRSVANAPDILKAYNQHRGLNPVIAPDPRAVALANQRLAAGGSEGAAAIQGGLSAIPFSNQIGGAIDTITGQGSPSYSVNRDANILYNEGLAKNHPLPYYGGQLVGGGAALGGAGGAIPSLLRMGEEGGAARAILDAVTNRPKTATTLGDMAYGGATNAGDNPDHPILGAMTGAVTGGLASGLGHGITSLGGKAVSAAGQRLNDLGINVPIWPKILPGGNARVADQNRQFGQEAFNQAANIVGGDSKAVGAPALDDLASLGQDAYGHALNPVTGVQLSPTAQKAVAEAFNRANALQDPNARSYALRSLNKHITNNFSDGAMDGAGFQSGYRGLSNDISSIPDLGQNSVSLSDRNDITKILGMGQDALVQSLKESHPEAFGHFLDANNMWRHMNVLGKATDAARDNVDAAGNAIFNSRQLSNASSQNARSYNGVLSAAQGERPFNQLLNDMNYAGAKPSSGSALGSFLSHSALPSLAFLAGGGAGEMEGGAEGAGIGALSLGALAASLGTRSGQRLLRRSLLGAPNGLTAGALPFTPNLNDWGPNSPGR